MRATGRVTNGYHRLQWTEAHQNVTLKVPASPAIAAAPKKTMRPAAPMLPRGMTK